MHATTGSALLFANSTKNAAAANPSTQALYEFCSNAHGKVSLGLMQHADQLASLIERETAGAQWSDSPADHGGRISLSAFQEQIQEHSDSLAMHLPRLEKALGITGLSQAVKVGTVPAAPVAKVRTVDQVVGARAMDPGRGLGR